MYYQYLVDILYQKFFEIDAEYSRKRTKDIL